VVRRASACKRSWLLLKPKDIADEVRAVLQSANRPLKAEEVLNALPSREKLIVQVEVGSSGYFAAVQIVREALAHVGASLHFIPMELDNVTPGEKGAMITPTRRLIPVYRLSS